MKLELEHKVFKILREVAASKGVQAYAVGGYVRDLIMKKPSKDLDVVVLGDGPAFAEDFAQAAGIQKNKVNIFKNFGTAQVKTDSFDIEFVGARKESYKSDSRKPEVVNATFEEDLLRRDFTINAMAVSLNTNDYGELTDLFGGLNDIEERVIRTPQNPAITFSDDPLRMMRAVRFATRLNFVLHRDVFDAIKANKNRLSIVSAERITDEFNKILSVQRPSYGIEMLFDTGLLSVFFPEFERLQGVEYVGKNGHKDNFYHTLQVLDGVCAKTDNIWLRWAAIMHDIAKPVTKKYIQGEGWTFHAHEFIGEKMAPAIFKRLKLPLGDNLKFVQKMIRLHLRPIVLSESDITDSAVRRLLFDAGNDIDALMLLCEADITSKNETKVKKYLENLRIVKQKLVEIEEKDRIREFQPPISGEEVMQIFNLTPSREVGIIKNAIKDAILDGIISNSYDEAYAFMLDVAKKNNITLPKK